MKLIWQDLVSIKQPKNSLTSKNVQHNFQVRYFLVSGICARKSGIFQFLYFTHYGLVMPYGDTYIWVNIGSSNGLMPDGTKPLFGPDLYLSLSRPWIPVVLHGICKTMLFISFQILTVARLRFKHGLICLSNDFLIRNIIYTLIL